MIQKLQRGDLKRIEEEEQLARVEGTTLESEFEKGVLYVDMQADKAYKLKDGVCDYEIVAAQTGEDVSPHTRVVAPSGAGKTTFAKHIVRQGLASDMGGLLLDYAGTGPGSYGDFNAINYSDYFLSTALEKEHPGTSDHLNLMQATGAMMKEALFPQEVDDDVLGYFNAQAGRYLMTCWEFYKWGSVAYLRGKKMGAQFPASVEKVAKELSELDFTQVLNLMNMTVVNKEINDGRGGKTKIQDGPAVRLALGLKRLHDTIFVERRVPDADSPDWLMEDPEAEKDFLDYYDVLMHAKGEERERIVKFMDHAILEIQKFVRPYKTARFNLLAPHPDTRKNINISDIVESRRFLTLHIPATDGDAPRVALARLVIGLLHKEMIKRKSPLRFVFIIDEFGKIGTEDHEILLSEIRQFGAALFLFYQYEEQMKGGLLKSVVHNTANLWVLTPVRPAAAEGISEELGTEKYRERSTSLTENVDAQAERAKKLHGEMGAQIKNLVSGPQHYQLSASKSFKDVDLPSFEAEDLATRHHAAAFVGRVNGETKKGWVRMTLTPRIRPDDPALTKVGALPRPLNKEKFSAYWEYAETPEEAQLAAEWAAEDDAGESTRFVGRRYVLDE